MAKNEIKKLIEGSKKSLTADYAAFEKSIKKDLASFKKDALARI